MSSDLTNCAYILFYFLALPVREYSLHRNVRGADKPQASEAEKTHTPEVDDATVVCSARQSMSAS